MAVPGVGTPHPPDGEGIWSVATNAETLALRAVNPRRRPIDTHPRRAGAA